MHQVKEYEIKNEFIFEKLNVKPAEMYLRIFLTPITHVDPSCFSRQVINSQVNAKNGTSS
jgi:hypothetical protein